MTELLNMIDLEACVKTDCQGYLKVRDSIRPINTTTLYRLYKQHTDNPVPFKEFYNWLKGLFYFDRYECKHGVEFLYYVKFKDLSIIDRLPNDVINVVSYIVCNGGKER